MSLKPLNVPELLHQFGLRPDKRLGQNFLIDPEALEQVVRASGVTGEDQVLEIGPGLGSLTRLLAKRAHSVVAVELDQRLIPALEHVLQGAENTRIVLGDILDLPPDALIESSGYVVVANIPYYITSAVIRHLLETRVQPRTMTLTIQKEVAERICAQPGDLSLLAVSVQVYGSPQIAAIIPSEAFYPAPQVDSAVVRIDLYAEPRISAGDLPAFFRVVKAGFSQKRKTLRNALAGGLAWKPAQVEALLQTAQIDPMRRAETLSIEEWGRVAALYTQQGAQSTKS